MRHMYQRKIPIDYNCGLIVAMEVIGSKWKFCLLDEISKGITRPRDLLQAVKGITRRVLQQQLRELELHDILGKTIYKEVPLRVEYQLTEAGHSILPLITALDLWGEGYAARLQSLLEKDAALQTQL